MCLRTHYVCCAVYNSIVHVVLSFSECELHFAFHLANLILEELRCSIGQEFTCLPPEDLNKGIDTQV